MHLKVYHVLFQMQNKMKWFHFPMELPSLLTLQGLAYNNQSTQNYFTQKPRSRLVLTILLRSCFPAFKRANLDRNLISFFCWGQFDGYSMEREASHMHHICRVTVSTTSSYPSLFSPGWASSLAIPLKCTLAIQRPLCSNVWSKRNHVRWTGRLCRGQPYGSNTLYKVYFDNVSKTVLKNQFLRIALKNNSSLFSETKLYLTTWFW